MPESMPIKSELREEYVRSRSRTLVSSLTMIAIIFIIYLALIYNQSRIMQASFENDTLEEKIAKIITDNVEFKDRVGRNRDLILIEKEAKEKLGMIRPLTGQIQNVYVPKKDYVITNDAYIGENALHYEEKSLQKAMDHVASYYLNLKERGAQHE